MLHQSQPRNVHCQYQDWKIDFQARSSRRRATTHTVHIAKRDANVAFKLIVLFIDRKAKYSGEKSSFQVNCVSFESAFIVNVCVYVVHRILSLNFIWSVSLCVFSMNDTVREFFVLLTTKNRQANKSSSSSIVVFICVCVCVYEEAHFAHCSLYSHFHTQQTG